MNMKKIVWLLVCNLNIAIQSRADEVVKRIYLKKWKPDSLSNNVTLVNTISNNLKPITADIS